MTDTAIDLARQLIDRVWNAGPDAGADLDAAAAALMPHSFTWDEDRLIGPTRVSGMGSRSLLSEVRANRRAFPDLELRVTDAFDDGPGRALVLWEATGTHDGELRLGNNRLTDARTLEPSGLAVRASGWTLVETAEGTIRSVRQVWHPMSLIQQLAVALLGLSPAGLLGLPRSEAESGTEEEAGPAGEGDGGDG